MANNEKKCYGCGKEFRTPAEYNRHKNRKTPCLIREINQEQLKNPNRCIFCNKIFINIGNKNRHLKTCKIKNGGMNMLADKVQYEQKIRLLEEKDKEKDEQIKQLTEKIDTLSKIMCQQPRQQVINNINNIGTLNIINNYLKPDLSHLINRQNISESPFCKIFDDNKVQTPIAIIPFIWFNPDKPNNYAIYLKNKSTSEILFYDGSQWKMELFQNGIGNSIRDRAYEITEKLLDILKVHNDANLFIIDNIKRNRMDIETAKYECEKIFKLLVENKNIIKYYTNRSDVNI